MRLAGARGGEAGPGQQAGGSRPSMAAAAQPAQHMEQAPAQRRRGAPACASLHQSSAGASGTCLVQLAVSVQVAALHQLQHRGKGVVVYLEDVQQRGNPVAGRRVGWAGQAQQMGGSLSRMEGRVSGKEARARTCHPAGARARHHHTQHTPSGACPMPTAPAPTWGASALSVYGTPAPSASRSWPCASLSTAECVCVWGVGGVMSGVATRQDGTGWRRRWWWSVSRRRGGWEAGGGQAGRGACLAVELVDLAGHLLQAHQVKGLQQRKEGGANEASWGAAWAGNVHCTSDCYYCKDL